MRPSQLASIFIISVLFFFSPLLPQDFRQKWFKPENGWTLKRRKDNICIFIRRQNVGNGRKIRLLKSAMLLDCPKENVLTAITNAEFAGKWIPRKKEYYQIPADDTGSWLAYVQLELPWPLKNMDFAAKYTLGRQWGTVSTITLRSASSAIPEKKGIKRMKQFRGAWTLEAYGRERTLVMYELCSTQRSDFPRMISDPIVIGNMLQTMDGLRRFIKQNSIALQSAKTRPQTSGRQAK